MRLVSARSVDWYLIGLVLLLVAIGIATIYTVTLARGESHLAWGQLGFLGIGALATALLMQADYRRLDAWAYFLYLGGLGLLGLVATNGTTVFGATRWLDLGPFQLQPSELMKLLVVLVVARVLARDTGMLRFRTLLFLLLVVAVPVLLVLNQPDLGTAGVLILTTLLLFAVAKLPRGHWLFLIAMTLISLPIVYFRLEPYQLERIQTFLSPQADPYGAGYNVLQSLIAVGNGGLFGQGIGQGSQSQLDFLPVVHTDFIFAGIAEATGFLGSSFVILIFALLIARAFWIARSAPDRFGLMIAMGLGSLWLVQFAINVGMNLGLAPVTGIPLPFVSHGGTALITNCAALGILESIAIRAREGSGMRRLA